MSPVDTTPFPIWPRDFVSDLKSAPETLSSWDNCMAKSYCKYVALLFPSSNSISDPDATDGPSSLRSLLVRSLLSPFWRALSIACVAASNVANAVDAVHAAVRLPAERRSQNTWMTLTINLHRCRKTILISHPHSHLCLPIVERRSHGLTHPRALQSPRAMKMRCPRCPRGIVP